MQRVWNQAPMLLLYTGDQERRPYGVCNGSLGLTLGQRKILLPGRIHG